MNKKSQSAMEYLMTYGWAILVVLIALGALFYLGVFSPKTPNICQFNVPFSCIGGDIRATEAGGSDTVTFKIGMQGGITSPTITSIKVNGGNDIKVNCGDISLTPGGQKTITCTTSMFTAAGERFSGTIDFSYTGEAGAHTTTGSFSGKVEASGL